MELEDWEACAEHCQEMIEGVEVYKELLRRYNSGERTQELFDAMMEVD